MVSIPRALAVRYGIRPGWRLDWAPGRGPDELVVRLLPDRAELGRRLQGAGSSLGRRGEAVESLVAERAEEG